MFIKDATQAFRSTTDMTTASLVANSPIDSAAIRIPGGNLNTPFLAEVDYYAAATGSGTGTAVFSVRRSPDDSTYVEHVDGASYTVALTTTAKKGKFLIPVCHPDDYTKIRVTLTGTGAAIKWSAYLADNC